MNVSRAMPKATLQIAIRIDPELYRQVRTKSDERGMSISAAGIEALTLWVEQEEREDRGDAPDTKR